MLGVHMVTIFLVSAFRQQEALFARRTTLLAIQLSDALYVAFHSYLSFDLIDHSYGMVLVVEGFRYGSL